MDANYNKPTFKKLIGKTLRRVLAIRTLKHQSISHVTEHALIN